MLAHNRYNASHFVSRTIATKFDAKTVIEGVSMRPK